MKAHQTEAPKLRCKALVFQIPALQTFMAFLLTLSNARWTLPPGRLGLCLVPRHPTSPGLSTLRCGPQQVLRHALVPACTHMTVVRSVVVLRARLPRLAVLTHVCCHDPSHRAGANIFIHRAAPGSGTDGTLLHLHGSIPTFDPEKLRVSIGGAACTLVSSQADVLSSVWASSLPLLPVSDVVCIVPTIPAGLYNLSVTALDTGMAVTTAGAHRTEGGDSLFSYEELARFDSVQPLYVSVAGGAEVIIRGTGFALSPDDNTLVLGGITCPLTFSSPNELRYIMPDLSGFNFEVLCTGIDRGMKLFSAAAGLGSVTAGSRGARLQVWNATAGVNALPLLPT